MTKKVLPPFPKRFPKNDIKDSQKITFFFLELAVSLTEDGKQWQTITPFILYISSGKKICCPVSSWTCGFQDKMTFCF